MYALFFLCPLPIPLYLSVQWFVKGCEWAARYSCRDATDTAAMRSQVFMAGLDYRGPHSIERAAPAPQQPCQAQQRAEAPKSPFAAGSQAAPPGDADCQVQTLNPIL